MEPVGLSDKKYKSGQRFRNDRHFSITMDKRVILCLVSAFIFTAQSAPSSRNGNGTVQCEDVEALDEAALHLFGFGDRCHRPPVTVDDLDNDYCPRTKMAVAKIRTFADQCFKPFPQQIIEIVLRGALNQARRNCDLEPGRERVLEVNQCTKDKNFEAYHQCSDTYTRQLEAIDKFENLDNKFPYTCCHFHSFKKCILDETRNFGCDEVAIDYTREYLRRISSEALDYACGPYFDGSDKCSELGPLALDSVQVARSLVPPLVNIMSSLSEEDVRRHVPE
ncbi:hypothetical protein HDE_10469 [Halotydeus destructor]|nr:hypothetical protein HDE_10469 [Halotydeus destructor]